MMPEILTRLTPILLTSIRYMWMALMGIGICCCAVSPPVSGTSPGSATVSQARTVPPKSIARPTVEQRLRAKAHQWEGTPHRMGGTQRNGVDCSGFVQRIFDDLFNIKLPRSTARQVRTGNAVAIHQLRPGDLVFFHPPDKVRHVGIYLGQGEFVHASTSKGVTISRLNTPYWRNAYWTARRIPAVCG